MVLELMNKNMYEHIKGKDLVVFLINCKDRTKPLHEKRVKSYIFQLLQALDHMHKNGIFHRDIKPENILLTGEKVKLADYGSVALNSL